MSLKTFFLKILPQMYEQKCLFSVIHSEKAVLGESIVDISSLPYRLDLGLCMESVVWLYSM